MMCEEIAVLISSCIRQSPPEAVTNNVVMAVAYGIVMLYHIGRLRAIVRAVRTRKMALCSRAGGPRWQRTRDP
jgi:hypothetical protein